MSSPESAALSAMAARQDVQKRLRGFLAFAKAERAGKPGRSGFYAEALEDVEFYVLGGHLEQLLADIEREQTAELLGAVRAAREAMRDE